MWLAKEYTRSHPLDLAARLPQVEKYLLPDGLKLDAEKAELFFDEGPVVRVSGLALRGAEVIVLPAAFTLTTGKDHWEILIRARAIENGVFMVAAAQVGQHPPGNWCYGRSMIVDPWGRVLASAGGTGEAVVLAEIDIAAVKAAHDKIPNLRNGHAFTLEVPGDPVKGGVAA